MDNDIDYRYSTAEVKLGIAPTFNSGARLDMPWLDGMALRQWVEMAITLNELEEMQADGN